ncbi:MAG: type II toxin-antitoxin system RelE/ParE family toxin [Lactobacillus sp.]|jgi:mRNA interferase RelE/StbE|nr:type II toxin-antitoxin system RelE/ParE family toxin [Lactobacillus sp.]
MKKSVYYWTFDEHADKKFSKLDPSVQRRIVNWLNKHIQGTDNPRTWGRALEGKLGTLWRYQVGRYRIIADIRDHEFKVAVVKVAPRGEVYKRQ